MGLLLIPAFNWGFFLGLTSSDMAYFKQDLQLHKAWRSANGQCNNCTFYTAHFDFTTAQIVINCTLKYALSSDFGLAPEQKENFGYCALCFCDRCYIFEDLRYIGRESTFIQAISVAPLQVHYYSEALPTQHG